MLKREIKQGESVYKPSKAWPSDEEFKIRYKFMTSYKCHYNPHEINREECVGGN